MRNCVFTLNNPADDDRDRILECLRFTYVIVANEVGAARGTPHLQGYVELNNPTSFARLRHLLLDRAHIDRRRGTATQAIDYCKKGDDFLERGEPKHQGARYDLDMARDLAFYDGMRAVTATCNAQAIRCAEKFLTYNEEPRDWKMDVHWYWGPTETGKSRTVRERALTRWKKSEIYIKNTPNKWFPGYDAHPCIIIDDFRPSWWEISFMLGIMDRYEIMVEFKGGERQCRAREMYITSSKDPQLMYANTGEAITQMLRRIDETIHLT